jgi:hypothetical protein
MKSHALKVKQRLAAGSCRAHADEALHAQTA